MTSIFSFAETEKFEGELKMIRSRLWRYGAQYNYPS